MTLTAALILLLTVGLILLCCYLVLLIVERLFGPLDPMVKSLLGVIVLILIVLYLLGHVGLLRLA